MSWLAEVRHVLVKDLREHRWLLLGYLAAVLVATLRAVSWLPLTTDRLGLVMLVVVLLGIFTVAAAVLGDSPVGSRAFWRAHPFRPSAVTGAKLVMLLLLVAIALVGQAIGAASYHLRGGALALLLARSVLAYGMWLVAALAVAAVVRDLRSFTLALLLVPIATVMVGAILLSGRSWEPSRAATYALGAAGAVAALLLVPWLYHVRDVGRLPRALGLLLVASPIVLLGAGDSGPVPLDRGAPLVGAPRLRLELPDGVLRSEGGVLRLLVTGDTMPAGQRLAIGQGELVVSLRGGGRLHVRLEYRALPAMAVVSAFGPGAATVSALPSDTSPMLDTLRRPVREEVRAPLTVEQWRAIQVGVERIELAGVVQVVERRTIALLPLVEGSGATQPGERVLLRRWAPRGPAPQLELQTSTLAGAGRGGREGLVWPEREALLVGADGRLIPLDHIGGGSAGEGLVIPGAGLSSQTEHFSLARLGRGAPAPPDANWYGTARLRVVTRRLHEGAPLRLVVDVPR